MSRYIIIILLMVLCSCSDKISDNKVKTESFKTTFKEYLEEPAKLKSDTLITYLNVQKTVIGDTVTYIYSDKHKNSIYNDTLKMSGAFYCFNGLVMKPKAVESLKFNGDVTKISRVQYLDMRAGLCFIMRDLYVNDSLGLIMKRNTSYGGTSIEECGSEFHQIQYQIKKNPVLFRT